MNTLYYTLRNFLFAERMKELDALLEDGAWVVPPNDDGQTTRCLERPFFEAVGERAEPRTDIVTASGSGGDNAEALLGEMSAIADEFCGGDFGFAERAVGKRLCLCGQTYRCHYADGTMLCATSAGRKHGLLIASAFGSMLAVSFSAPVIASALAERGNGLRALRR